MIKKARVIVLGTGAATRKFILDNVANRYIEIMGIILDGSVEADDNKEFINGIRTELGHDIEEYSFALDSMQKADIVFSTEYRCFIPEEFTNSALIVNCHGGLLPKWRGACANAWAIMNDEKEVGFTIHRVRTGMDDGEIYFQKRIGIRHDQTYADVHNEMLEGIASEVPKVLYDVVCGNNKGEAQPTSGFVFCSKFTRAMGDISGFERDSEYYVNLYRCMSKPLGTGIWFNYRGDRYDVGKVENAKNFGVIDYLGIPGKVVNIQNGKMFVKTKDNAVVLSEITKDEISIEPDLFFRNGNKL